MPGNVNPQQQSIVVASLPSVVTFDAGVVGAIALENTGSQDCWFVINGSPNNGGDGDGKTRLVAGGSFADSNLECSSVGLVTAVSTTTIQIYSKEVGG